MLNATRELITLINSETENADDILITTLTHAIVQCGGKDDAQALLKQFLSRPVEINNSYYFPVFSKYGEQGDAERIFKTCFIGNQLIEGASSEILELLGLLQYEPIKPILIQYAFAGWDCDYCLSKYAVLGLLSFDCSDIEQLISEEIRKIFRHSIFPEFIPALVCKLRNRDRLLQELYDFGSTVCSTDCNAGIILGFSLCGAEGRGYFKNALNDPNWEIQVSGTGTIYHAYQGMLNLGLSFNELFTDIKHVQEREHLTYALNVLLDLLEVSIKRSGFEYRQPESFRGIYLDLFGRENENIIDFCSQVNQQNEAYRIRDLLHIKMKEEAILESIERQGGERTMKCVMI